MRTFVRCHAIEVRENVYIYSFTYKGMIYGVKVQNMVSTNLRIIKISV